MAGISRKLWLGVAAVVVIAILTLAWIDGGEEEIELIVNEIDVPENAQ